MKQQEKNIIVIGGPTASGKTNCAIAVAQHQGGEIISADSRQVYIGMDIGTGKDLHEYNTPAGKVPYHLIDRVKPDDIYTLYHFQHDCFKAIKHCWKERKIPILTGGTGLYIEAVLKNYNIANVPENKQLRDSLNTQSKENLIHRLKTLNTSLYNSTDISSKKRIIRSIEISVFSDTHVIQYGSDECVNLVPCFIGIQWPRSALKDRIFIRLEQRLKEGLIEEVEKLLTSGISSERFEYFGMEYKHVSRYLQKKIPFQKMVDDLANDIFRFSKRQMTYFKGMERRGVSISWVEKPDFQEIFEIVTRYVYTFS